MQMNEPLSPAPMDHKTRLLLLGLSLGLFLFHLATALFSTYGYFIDELYYLSCSLRPALGYVDHPPLSVLILTLNRWLLGDSLLAMRLLPALSAAATLYLTGLMTLRLGGSRRAVILAALASLLSPVILIFGSFYSMNAFELLIMAALLYLTVRLVQEYDTRLLIPMALLVGLGLENKHTMGVYVVALAFGLLVSRSQRLLWNRHALWGALIVLVVVSPNLVWQLQQGFPSLEFYRNAMVYKNIPTGPLQILAAQTLFNNPGALPLWLTGFFSLLWARKFAPYRLFAWAYLFLLATMILSQSSRPDRIAAFYPILFAAGAIALTDFLPKGTLRRVLRPLFIASLLLSGLLFLPVGAPLLPPQTLKEYLRTIHFSFAIESGKSDEAIPQWLADRFGWREIAAEMSRIYRALPQTEREKTVVISDNYATAGLMELFGRDFDLPRVFGTHNTFYLWGPPPQGTKTFLAVSIDLEDLQELFTEIVEVGQTSCAHCTLPNRLVPIYRVRGPKFPLCEIWSRLKNYD